MPVLVVGGAWWWWEVTVPVPAVRIPALVRGRRRAFPPARGPIPLVCGSFFLPGVGCHAMVAGPSPGSARPGGWRRPPAARRGRFAGGRRPWCLPGGWTTIRASRILARCWDTAGAVFPAIAASALTGSSPSRRARDQAHPRGRRPASRRPPLPARRTGCQAHARRRAYLHSYADTYIDRHEYLPAPGTGPPLQPGSGRCCHMAERRPRCVPFRVRRPEFGANPYFPECGIKLGGPSRQLCQAHYSAATAASFTLR